MPVRVIPRPYKIFLRINFKMFVHAKRLNNALQRSFRTSAKNNAKILCALYDDPVTGYPPLYARESIPRLERYPDGQTVPKAESIDFTPGDLLGCVSGELGLRKFLENLFLDLRDIPMDKQYQV